MGAWKIAKKDLLLLVRDRRALVVLVALPLVFIAIIGMSTGQMLGWRNRNEQLHIVLVNQNDGQLAELVVERLEQAEGLEVSKVSDESQAREMMQDDEQLTAVIIGPHFQERIDDMAPFEVLSGDGDSLATNLERIDMQVISPRLVTNAAALTRMIVHAETMKLVVPVVLKKNAAIAHALRVQKRREELAAERGDAAPQPPAPEVPRWSGQYGSVVYQKVVPAYTVMFAFFLVTVMSRSFLTERELGTMRRLKTTPVSSTSLMLGKVAPFYLISLVQCGLLFIFGRLLFGMSWGNEPLLLIPVILATAAAATGLGLLIASIVRSDAQVTSVAMLVVLAMAGVSGCFMPRDWLPDAMKKASLAIPHSWALIAYDEILNEAVPELQIVWRCCVWLLVFAGGYSLLGWLRFRTAEV